MNFIVCAKTTLKKAAKNDGIIKYFRAFGGKYVVLKNIEF